jgi:hypothetical protein
MPISNQVEEWRDIPGWEGVYQASRHGRVRGCARVVAGGRKIPQRICAPQLRPSAVGGVVGGGCFYTLSDRGGRGVKRYSIAGIMYATFKGRKLSEVDASAKRIKATSPDGTEQIFRSINKAARYVATLHKVSEPARLASIRVAIRDAATRTHRNPIGNSHGFKWNIE